MELLLIIFAIAAAAGFWLGKLGCCAYSTQKGRGENLSGRFLTVRRQSCKLKPKFLTQ